MDTFFHVVNSYHGTILFGELSSDANYTLSDFEDAG